MYKFYVVHVSYMYETSRLHIDRLDCFMYTNELGIEIFRVTESGIGYIMSYLIAKTSTFLAG